MTKKISPENISEAIRAEIEKIPPTELIHAKPSRVLPYLEEAGIEITPSVRSLTSKLLGKAKDKQKITPQGGIISVTEAMAESKTAADRKELAMRLVEGCDNDFEVARAELARLEEFARKIKGA